MNVVFILATAQAQVNEPHHKKTNNLHMQNQRRRSALQLLCLCFRYRDSTILQLSIKILNLQSLGIFSAWTARFCVGPVRKPHCWLSHKVAQICSNIMHTSAYFATTFYIFRGGSNFHLEMSLAPPPLPPSNLIASGLKILLLTHLSLASFQWDIGKQYSPRCDAAEHGIPSGAILCA